MAIKDVPAFFVFFALYETSEPAVVFEVVTHCKADKVSAERTHGNDGGRDEWVKESTLGEASNEERNRASGEERSDNRNTFNK